MVKNTPANAGNTEDTGWIPGSGRSPGGVNGKPTPVFLPGKSCGQRSLAGNTVHKIPKLFYTTEQLIVSFFTRC